MSEAAPPRAVSSPLMAVETTARTGISKLAADELEMKVESIYMIRPAPIITAIADHFVNGIALMSTAAKPVPLTLLDQKAGNLQKKLVGIEIEDKAIPRAGYPVLTPEGEEVGVVTTGYHSISLDKSICFALVDKAVAALDTPLCIGIRKKVFPGKVVKKRFYQTLVKLGGIKPVATLEKLITEQR